MRCLVPILSLLLLPAGPAAVAAPIRVGAENNSPPLSYVNDRGGHEGFTADLLREMERTGLVEFVTVPSSWSFVLQEFSAGRLDAMANVTINEERLQTMDFTISHASLHAITYTRPGEPRMRRTVEFAGRRMATLDGTITHINARRNQGWGAEIRAFGSWRAMLAAVRDGECDFALVTRSLKFEQPDELGLRVEFVDDIVYQFHFAVHRGDRETLARLNEALAIVRQNGAFDRIYAQWIGPIEPHPIRLNDLRPYALPSAGVLALVVLLFWWQRQINRQLRRQSRALHESEEKYRVLVENAHELIFVVQDGTVQFVNSAACRLTGLEEAALLGRSIFDFLPEAYRAAARARYEEILGGGLREAREDYPVTFVPGRSLWLEVTSVRIEWRGRPATLNLAADATARHAAEMELRDSLREKEALLREIHHRVKNNLQVITSLLRLEAGRSAQPATKAALQDMQGRIRSMALLHETLYRSADFARVDMADYLRQLSTQLHRAQNTRPGAVRLQLDLEPVMLEAEQAIPCGLMVNELLTNSLKHAFPDGRSGEIRIALHARPDGRVQLEVGDNGTGLPADLDERRQRSLGLQLVSDLVRQLQGTLEAGAAGPGARFVITLIPLKPSEAPGNGSPVTAAQP
ncbi:MAG: transporter substrate-binding domain-containing protein [Opitutaceae bacterium]|nr:transporter substrate-binding domain-containing protein [Opitutaceae bacterium]